MQILCYTIADSGLNLLGLCENAISILWVRSFYKGDTFTIRVPATAENITLFAKYQAVELMFDTSVNNSKFCGIITDFNIAKSISGEEITVSGMSSDGFLERRILKTPAAEYPLVSVIRINIENTTRKFPATVFSTEFDVEQTSSEALRYKSIAELVKVEGEKQGVGLQTYVVHNLQDKPFFEIKLQQGINRTVHQNINKPIILSDSFENAYDMEYDYSDNGAVNAVFVYSQENINDKTMSYIEAFEEWFEENQPKTGYERIEKVVKISPVTAEDENGVDVLLYNKTYDRAHQKAITQRANPTEFFDTKMLLPPSVKGIIELGDIVTVQNVRWGIQADKRLTEIAYMWDKNGEQMSATMGETYKSTLEILNSKQEG